MSCCLCVRFKRLWKRLLSVAVEDLSPIVGADRVLSRVDRQPQYVVLSVKYDRGRFDCRWAEYCQYLLGPDRCYSPNKHSKADCRRECLGDPQICGLPVREGQSPTSRTCWKSSYRWHLDGSNGRCAVMLRLKVGRTYGGGQRIEAQMAESLGLDVVEIQIDRSPLGYIEDEVEDKIALLVCVVIILAWMIFQTSDNLLKCHFDFLHACAPDIVRWVVMVFGGLVVTCLQSPSMNSCFDFAFGCLYAGVMGQLMFLVSYEQHLVLSMVWIGSVVSYFICAFFCWHRLRDSMQLEHMSRKLAAAGFSVAVAPFFSERSPKWSFWITLMVLMVGACPVLVLVLLIVSLVVVVDCNRRLYCCCRRRVMNI